MASLYLHLAHYVKTCHPQSWKYITYCTVEENQATTIGNMYAELDMQFLR